MITEITGWIAKLIVTMALKLLRRRLVDELRARGVRSFRTPGMMPLMEASLNVGIVWQGQSIVHLHLPGLGNVLVITEGFLAEIALHQMLTTHDWEVDVNGLRARFHPERLAETGVL